MNDFKGKVVRVSLNSSYGIICAIGAFIKMDNYFLVLLNQITQKVEYYSMFNIKSITIVDEISSDDNTENVEL